MKSLRTHLAGKNLVATDATDEQVKAAASEALKKGDLSPELFIELTEQDKKPVPESKSLMDELVEKLAAKLTPKEAPKETQKQPTPEEILEKATALAAEREKAKQPAPHDVLGETAKAGDGHLRVKKATERYNKSRRTLTVTKGVDEGKPLMHLVANYDSPNTDPVPKQAEDISEAEKAKLGAIFKTRLAKMFGMEDQLTEHTRELVKEAAHEDAWVGLPNQTKSYGEKLRDFDIKAVLDESGASRGDQAVPEYFDYGVIMTPLLYGELFPHVQLVRVPRGSSADAYKIGTPTFESTASGSAITPFSTTSFVTAFDTTFYPASCAIEFGLDFLSDADPQFAARVMEQIGYESMRWLDEQIAIGDGTTEPQGIFVATNTDVPEESSHTFSSFSYNDVINVAFGITKPHRNAFGGSFTRFVMNDPQYKEILQIVTGVTGDTRPIFGMGWKSYMLADYPVSVQNNISNGNFCLANLRGYRMYQRQGLEFVSDETGRTSRLANTKLVLGRMRWGGQLTLAGYVGELTAP